MESLGHPHHGSKESKIKPERHEEDIADYKFYAGSFTSSE